MIVGLTIIILASTLWLSNSHQIPVKDFAVIYASGIPMGAGVAIVVASYKVTREIRGK